MCTVTAAVIGTLAGGLWQGYQQRQQANAQARAAEAEAARQKQMGDQMMANANAEQQRAYQQAQANHMNEENEREAKRRMLSQTVANTGASNVTMSGSALNVLASNQYMIDKDMAMTGYNNRQKVDEMFNTSTNYFNNGNQYYGNAESYKQAARNYRKAGRRAMWGSLLTSAFSLAGSLYTPKSAATQGSGFISDNTPQPRF